VCVYRHPSLQDTHRIHMRNLIREEKLTRYTGESQSNLLCTACCILFLNDASENEWGFADLVILRLERLLLDGRLLGVAVGLPNDRAFHMSKASQARVPRCVWRESVVHK
jgi:hypothetical protein